MSAAAFFTVESRDAIGARLIEKARADRRVVSGARIGSLAAGGDRWSDLDLTFGLAPGVTPLAILDAWTPELEAEFGAVPLFDLPFRSSLYRVFLFPGALQVDLSFTPGHEFGALGPRFAPLFGESFPREPIVPHTASHRLGLAVHHALRARVCIERGRMLQAEHWIGELRDETLALACLRRGLEPGHARGADDLPAETRDAAQASLARSYDRGELTRALRAESEPGAVLDDRVDTVLRLLASEPPR